VSLEAVVETDGTAEAIAWVHVMDCSEELFGCDFSVFNSIEQAEANAQDYALDTQSALHLPFASAF
jgi:hypothetical protein